MYLRGKAGQDTGLRTGLGKGGGPRIYVRLLIHTGSENLSKLVHFSQFLLLVYYTSLWEF